MAKYVDGFVAPIRKEKVEDYRKMAQAAGEVWKEHGALDYFEAIGDDLEHGQMVSFAEIAGANEDETVILAWIVFESRAERDRINKLVMADERIKTETDRMPFDYQRMAYGGFRTIVEL